MGIKINKGRILIKEMRAQALDKKWESKHIIKREWPILWYNATVVHITCTGLFVLHIEKSRTDAPITLLKWGVGIMVGPN